MRYGGTIHGCAYLNGYQNISQPAASFKEDKKLAHDFSLDEEVDSSWHVVAHAGPENK